MRASLLIAAAAVSAVVPMTALAARTQTLEFAEGQINATWEGKGPITMTRTPGGILLQSTGTGLFITDTDLTISPDAGAIRASVEGNAGVYFVWIFKGDPEENSYSVGIDLLPGGGGITPFSLSEARNWSPAPKKIALVLPPYTAFLLHDITFTEWNPAEKALIALQSFWTPDRYRPYTINFVWGPQLAWNPVQRSELYTVLPPTSVSGVFVLYGALILGLLVISAWVMFGSEHDKKRRIILTGAVWTLMLWAILDIRMGSEFLTWVTKDAETYIAAPESVRTFRDRDRFYDFAAFAAPYVSDRGTYIFFAEQQWPYLGNMRYLTYPSIPGVEVAKDDTWVIYRRSDIVVDESNRLSLEGYQISLPGRILGRFDDASFVFRTDPEPVPVSPASP